ncbi:methyltransferase domain-containing protein [Patescibacteria group bacterium]|nr:methyltransferase domain-containing protein [Patescibacteria group bacterium]MBU0963648.1 methyltransferase domain-containing protein [Patescibacteria group bacterium]
MDNNNFLLDSLIQCPTCGHELVSLNNSFTCSDCGKIYTSKEMVLNLLPKKNNKFRDIEQEFWNYTYDKEGSRDIANRNFAFHHHFRQPLIDLPSGSKVIELGCGTRADSIEIALSNKYVVATDISMKAIQLARSLAKQMKANSMKFILAEAENLPFKNDNFDGALMAASFHHIENPEAGLLEMKRIVKKGGYIILGVEPNSWPYKTIYMLLNPLKSYIRKTRKRNINSIADDTTEGFSKKSLIKILEKNNLEIIEIKPIKFTLEFYDSYLRLKERLGSRNINASKNVQQFFNSIDKIIEKIPLIKNYPWHWNVIARVK